MILDAKPVVCNCPANRLFSSLQDPLLGKSTPMKSIFILTTSLLIASAAFAAEPRVQRDLPYAEPKHERQTLDIYAPTASQNKPIVFWIHGGGWRQGSKNAMQSKPQAFVEKGFVFIAMNYRFVPQVTLKEMTGDIAKSIRY